MNIAAYTQKQESKILIVNVDVINIILFNHSLKQLVWN